MKVRLRGHHLLCLLGYRGKGYSEDFCANMTFIYETLRGQPDTLVGIVNGPDDICAACPEQHAHCRNESIDQKDAEVLEKVGAAPGSEHRWSELLAAIAGRVVPGDIAKMCRNCPWRPLGVCEEGVRLVNRGEPLPAVGAPLLEKRFRVRADEL